MYVRDFVLWQVRTQCNHVLMGSPLPFQVMEVDSLRGVVIAGSQRPAGVGRMAKHVARLDPIRPTHM